MHYIMPDTKDISESNLAVPCPDTDGDKGFPP